jgi:hypothetical protein
MRVPAVCIPLLSPVLLLLIALSGPGGCAATPGTSANPAAPTFNAAGSDPAAIDLADRTMEAMGGRAAWDATRYITWNFFGARLHFWDRATGNVRIESRAEGIELVILMNVETLDGRAWRNGEEVEGGDDLASLIQTGYQWWVNDSYWLVAPYKLKDDGVTLRYLGVGATEAGAMADIIEVTFAGVGVTPRNKYHVYVAKDSGLVEQWDFYADAADEQPAFSAPWNKWKRYGDIKLSSDRGMLRGRAIRLSDIAVYDVLPESIFTEPQLIDRP